MLSRRQFLLASTLAVAMATASALPAQTAPAPDQFIRELGGELLSLLSRKEIGAAEREAEFRRLFVKGADVDLLARFALGRYWREASEAERREYRELFESFVVKSYAQRLAGYSGETFTIQDTRAIDERDTLVNTHIERPGGQPPLRVDWRLRRTGQELRVIDMMVEGISMAVTQREEFTSVIHRNGGKVSELNNLLRERIAALN
ncbi:MAG: ABC transporter substrate-binding protein [Alphaproteobacteria bacterium]|nr:ABC transporter substrate-binding protein [Alphaproteobacteria bacterium]